MKIFGRPGKTGVLDEQKRILRSLSRDQILAAANALRQTHRPGAPVLYGRHIQTAVCIVRRNRLVKPEVLTAAGYNA